MENISVRSGEYAPSTPRDDSSYTGFSSPRSESISTTKKVKIYLGNLDPYTTRQDIENLFSNYYITSIWLARKPPGFGFVYVTNLREAEKAVNQLNGYELRGRSIKVEIGTDKPRKEADVNWILNNKNNIASVSLCIKLINGQQVFIPVEKNKY